MLETEKELGISLVPLSPKFSLDMETRLFFITGKMAFLLQEFLAIAVTVEGTSNNFVLIIAAVDGR